MKLSEVTGDKPFDKMMKGVVGNKKAVPDDERLKIAANKERMEFVKLVIETLQADDDIDNDDKVQLKGGIAQTSMEPMPRARIPFGGPDVNMYVAFGFTDEKTFNIFILQGKKQVGGGGTPIAVTKLDFATAKKVATSVKERILKFMVKYMDLDDGSKATPQDKAFFEELFKHYKKLGRGGAFGEDEPRGSNDEDDEDGGLPEEEYMFVQAKETKFTMRVKMWYFGDHEGHLDVEVTAVGGDKYAIDFDVWETEASKKSLLKYVESKNKVMNQIDHVVREIREWLDENDTDDWEGPKHRFTTDNL